MHTLPPVAPATGWRCALRLPRDHYIRLDGQRLLGAPGSDRAADRGDRRPGPCRRGLGLATLSDPEHLAAAKLLRTQRACVLHPISEPQVQIRSLHDYDTALGLETPGLDAPSLDTGRDGGTVAGFDTTGTFGRLPA